MPRPVALAPIPSPHTCPWREHGLHLLLGQGTLWDLCQHLRLVEGVLFVRPAGRNLLWSAIRLGMKSPDLFLQA